MKKEITLFACVALSGCCTINGNDVSLKELSDRNRIISPQSISTHYPDHFVACRADYSDPKEKRIVDNIARQATNSGKHIVLYFHGGLSSQGYMDDDLGKNLMQKVFYKEGIEDKIYPIFLNYDAGILDWDSESVNVKSVIKDVQGQNISDAIKAVMGSNGDKSLNSQEQQAGAAMAIYRFAGNSQAININKANQKQWSEDEIEYFSEILKAKELPPEFKTNPGNKDARSELSNLAAMISDVVSAEYQRQLESPDVIEKFGRKKIDKSDSKSQLSTILPSLELRVLRILARIAINTDHGIDATVYEEILDAISMALGAWFGDSSFKIGRVHWDKVKRHSKQCFSEGSNGRVLVDSLFKAKAESVKVHTLSHSAGAIPTAELIKYLAENGVFSLDSVVMLVPAINQYVFSRFVMPFDSAYKKLTVFSLKQANERNDDVVAKLIYPASLLYFVSSNAEDKWHFDQMLLIEQHMKDESPYNSTAYQKLICEEPEKLWKYFGIGDSSSINMTEDRKVRFRPYPFGDTEVRPGAATHEGTKYPWVAYDLAREYFKIFGVENADKLNF